MTIETKQLDGFKISDFYRIQKEFNLHPPYQRDSNVWSTSQKALFIDSIINGYLIPSIYIESTARHDTKTHTRWSVLDGQQRLTTILEFADDKIKLSDEFIYFADRNVEAQNMTLSQLREIYPSIARRFDTFTIPTIAVKADSTDEIEEMFERLNSSTSLNAAEVRNAIGGPMRELSNELSKHQFFTKKCPIKNFRYKYRELASKLITIELQIQYDGRLKDLKANTLKDVFQRSKKDEHPYTRANLDSAKDRAHDVLDSMTSCFQDDDPLLRSIGSLVVYYLCFRDGPFIHSRDEIEQFEFLRMQQRRIDNEDTPEDETPQSFSLRQYNARVQSSNDGRPLTDRAHILQAYLSNPEGEWAQDLHFD